MHEPISDLMTRDHVYCDELFAAAEGAPQGDAARAAWSDYVASMHRHFDAEEATLFPALERAAGGSLPPVRVMLMEHGQMRELFAEIDAAASRGDWDEVSGLAQTLLVVMEQHNLKEQNVLYPMADRLLGDGSSLASRLAGLGQR